MTFHRLTVLLIENEYGAGKLKGNKKRQAESYDDFTLVHLLNIMVSTVLAKYEYAFENMVSCGKETFQIDVKWENVSSG